MKLLFLLTPLLPIFFGSQKWLRIRRETLTVPNLPQDLQGFTICHISDLHADNRKRIHVNLWKALDKLSFDVVVMTGDFIIKKPTQLTPHLPDLKKLCAKKPVYFVDGNHDRFHRYPEFAQLLSETGLRVLVNQKEFLKVKDAGIEFIGIGNHPRKRLWHIKSLFGRPLPEHSIRVVLCHMPQLFDLFKIYQPHLTFAGHTHGGQLRLPFLPTLYAPDQGIFPKYGYGPYAFCQAKLWVSKGIGHTYFPVRFWNRPEILLYTLENEKPE